MSEAQGYCRRVLPSLVKSTPSTLLYFVFAASTVSEARFSHAAKASAPIVVTLAGIVTLVSPEQLNAFALMVVTDEGKWPF